MSKKLKVLSLFDGMSGGQQALDRLGIKVKKYYASEVDKYAITITQKNYPNTVQLGSVTELKKIKDIDLLIGGSPCQGFSVAGKMRGMVTKCNTDITTLKQYKKLKKEGFEFDGQSYLFWEYVRMLKKCKPKYFILENVRVQKKWVETFNVALDGIEPVLINSTLLSAQNRNRYYWVGKLQEDGTYKQVHIEQPEDRGIMMKDILVEGEATEEMTTKGKSFCVTARYSGAVAWNSIERKQRSMVALRPCKLKDNPSSNHIADATDIIGMDCIKRVYGEDGKSATLTTCTGGHREPKVLVVPEATKKGYTEIKDGDCFDAAVPNSKTRRGRNMKDKSNALLTSNHIAESTYRKLTPLECERLQTVIDGYTEGVSNSQRYKMLGNGFTIEVIMHIIKGLKNGK